MNRKQSIQQRDVAEEAAACLLTPQVYRRCVAVHEAGHAVIAAVLGLHVVEAAISLRDAPVGYLQGGHARISDGWEIDNDCRWDRHDRDRRRSRQSRNIAHICTVLAGRLSEQVILGAASGEDQHYSGDERLRVKFVKAAGLTSKQADSLYRQTCRLIRRHRKKIINLAKAVLDHPRGRVGRRTIKQIMKTDAECTAIRNEKPECKIALVERAAT